MNSVLTFLQSRKLGLTLVMQMSYLCANYNSTRNQVDEEPLCGCATPKIIIYLFICPKGFEFCIVPRASRGEGVGPHFKKKMKKQKLITNDFDSFEF